MLDKKIKRQNTAKILGAIIKEMRLMRELSQKELSIKTNISFQQIQKYENGINVVSINNMVEICNVLNIDFIDVFKDFKKKMNKK